VTVSLAGTFWLLTVPSNVTRRRTNVTALARQDHWRVELDMASDVATVVDSWIPSLAARPGGER